eukprot:gb/GEZN01003784.1/.p1 GENE.gb/GEZN01003784.1/~~gb/GEZN01003784.1/.p1  ORF type:complete len:592 (-),score=58.03 gb/GEZN01003784.1/:287-2062(-)
MTSKAHAMLSEALPFASDSASSTSPSSETTGPPPQHAMGPKQANRNPPREIPRNRPLRKSYSDQLSDSTNAHGNSTGYSDGQTSQSQSTEPTFTVKLDLQGDTRRLKLKSKTLFEGLQSVKKCFGLKPREFSMSYRDDEGDMVAVYLDQELIEAFDVAEKQKKVLKLYIKPLDSSSSMTSSSQDSQEKSLSSHGTHSRTTISHGRSFHSSVSASTSGASGGDPSEARRGQRKQWREKRADANRNQLHAPGIAGSRDTLFGERMRMQRERPTSESTSGPARSPPEDTGLCSPMAVCIQAAAAAAADRLVERTSGSSDTNASSSSAPQKHSEKKRNPPIVKRNPPVVKRNPPLVVSGAPTTVICKTEAKDSDKDSNSSSNSGGSGPWMSGAWLNQTYKAKFIKDVNLPDRSQAKPSQTLIKTWQLSNSGTVDWPRGTGVKLFRSCTRTTGKQDEPWVLVDPESRFPVQAAAPGQMVDVSVILTTPSVEGRCRAFFRLVTDENQFFGPRMWLDVDVLNSPSDSVVIPIEGGECDEVVHGKSGRDLCEEFELLRNVSGTAAVHEDELYAASNSSGSKAGSERSSDNAETSNSGSD